MTVLNTHVVCPVCGREGAAVEGIRLSDRRKGLRGSWEVVTCSSCGTRFMDPMPTDVELSGYYSAYTNESDVIVRSGIGSRAPRLRRTYHWLSGDIDPRDFVMVPLHGKVLDYGSGNGTYLSFFHSRGVDITGADISDVMVSACSQAGLKMRRVDDFDVIPFADEEFDVVYLMQVFEHLRDPRRFMAELARILKPGGRLYLAVPNAASVWRRVFRTNWVSGWFAPFHLAHYTSSSLSDLGEEFGLVTAASWSRTPESWFRLNLKAALFPRDNQIESRRSFIDFLPMRVFLMATVRVIELFVRERDCLVVAYEKY